MGHSETAQPSEGSSRAALLTRTNRYSRGSRQRATRELAATIGLVGIGFGVGFLAWGSHWSLGLASSPILAIALVRTFVIQHDCGHDSFFQSPSANRFVGRVLSILTLVPFTQWKNDHRIHHATSGNLAKRGTGDIDTLTVSEYDQLSQQQKAVYRLYRNPFVLLGVGGPFYVLAQNRLPSGNWSSNRENWMSSQGLNLALFGLTFTAIANGIALDMAKLLVPALFLYGSIGVALFFVGHQFEDGYWARAEKWRPFDAAMAGSSHLALPKPLAWLTGNIGVHNLHHLNPRIPSYNLGRCQSENAALMKHVVHLRDLPRLMKLSLWDEDLSRLVSFRGLDRRRRAGPES